MLNLKVQDLKKNENIYQSKRKKNQIKFESIIEKLENTIKNLDLFKKTI